MRLLATADLHYNHPKSRRLADELIDQINSIPADVLLLIGDTAAADSDNLEQCLGRFRFSGEKLFVAGNHELWTAGDDSYRLYTQELPRRVEAMGWRWLQTEPYVRSGVAIAGSIGWYDYSFAQAHLGIPRRFYAHKVSPGAAAYGAQHAHLLASMEDIPPGAREIFARWNDGKFVKLHRTDEAFVEELLEQLDRQLAELRHIPHVVVAMHHIPVAELLPPPASDQWDFVKAYLGSRRFGECLLRYPNVRTILTGHTHMGMEAKIGGVQAISIGSGYRMKAYRLLELPGGD